MPLFKKAEPPLDPFERAARRVDPQYAQLADAAESVPPRSIRAPRLLVGFGLLVALFAVVRGGHVTAPLTASCRTPGFALSSTTVDYDAPLSWSAAGPADLRAVLALDATTLPSTPDDGPVALTHCLARGSFPVQARSGKHTLTLFLVRPDGTVARTLTKSLTVQ